MNIVSTLINGFVLVRPVLEVKAMYENRGRVVASFIFAAAAFVFFMSGILMGIIELVLQYDDQGFVLWSVMLGIATLFFVLGAICALGAKIIFPKPPLVATPRLQDVIHQILQALAERYPAPPSQGEDVSVREAMNEREKVKHHPRGDFNLDQAAAVLPH